MKKTYQTPRMELTLLEKRDVLCSSIRVEIVTKEIQDVSGELPPIAYSDIQSYLTSQQPQG